MKLVVAVVQPQQLPAVKRALTAAQVYHMTATNVLGTAPERDEHHVFRGVDQEVDLFQKVRLEIAVNEAFVEPTIDAIIEGIKRELSSKMVDGGDGGSDITRDEFTSAVLAAFARYQVRTQRETANARVLTWRHCFFCGRCKGSRRSRLRSPRSTATRSPCRPRT